MQRLTHAAFWRATWPVMISHASIPLLSLSDTFVASRSALDTSLPALVLGAKVYKFVGLVFFFLAISTCALVSRSLGRQDEAQARLWLLRSLCLGAAISVCVVPVVHGVGGPWLRLLGADVETFAPAHAYVQWRLLGLPALILLESFLGYFMGRLATRSVMLITLAMNVLNIALNVVFVLGVGTGVEGIAWATVISQWVGVVCAVVLFVRVSPGWVPWREVFALDAWCALISANRDLLMRSICVLGYLQGITYMSGVLGRTMVAAMGLAMTVMLAASFIQDSLGRTTEAFVSRWSQSAAQLQSSLWLSAQWFLGASLLFCTVFGLGRDFILHGISPPDEVVVAAQSVWPYLLVYVALLPANYFLNASLVGLQAFAALRNVYVVSFSVFVLSILALFHQVPTTGVLWVCVAIFDLSRFLLMARALSCSRGAFNSQPSSYPVASQT